MTVRFEPPSREIYPCRPDQDETAVQRFVIAVQGGILNAARGLRAARLGRVVKLVDGHGGALAGGSDADLAVKATALLRRSLRDGVDDHFIGLAFALVREVAQRVLGARCGDIELKAGYALLQGMFTELPPGEGKAFAVALAAATAALARTPVHVITADDSAAQHAAESMAPLYEALGLTVAVASGADDARARQQAYRADIAYVSNRQAAFDHLQDRVLLHDKGGSLRLRMSRLHDNGLLDDRLFMRGLHFAIVVDADSVLIDEARAPLVISERGSAAVESQMIDEALGLAATLRPGTDYAVARSASEVSLTDSGRDRVADWAADHGGLWAGRMRGERFAELALTALHLFQADTHYRLSDGAIEFSDPILRQAIADPSSGQSLRQMIETKEGLPIRGQPVTVAQITYQRFFRRYRRLAGVSATAREVAGEVWRVYRLPFAPLAGGMSRPRFLGTRVAAGESENWRVIAGRAAALCQAGRPVLIGLRGERSLHDLARELDARDTPHRAVLGDDDAATAEAMALAGGSGAVTLVAAMAGQGIGIPLTPTAQEAGGLHVMLAELHDSRRLDRQFATRAGRHGNPGSFEFILSLDDPVLQSGWPKGFAAGLADYAPRWLYGLGRIALAVAQRRIERSHARLRKAQLEVDARRRKALAFAGLTE